MLLELEHLGALPELEEFGCSQQWQTNSSFSDLELTGSGSATSWLGCDLLLDVEEAEGEYSSKLLSQEFNMAPAPVPALVPQLAAAPTTTISGYSCAASLYSGASPYGAPLAAAPAQGVPAIVTAVLPAPASPATSGSNQHSSLCGTSVAAVAPLLATSRAASPEPDWRDEEAVRVAGLALQLAQGDVNHAMVQLLAWATMQ